MATLFLFASCTEPFTAWNIDLPEGKGSFSLSLSSARTILPTAPLLDDFANYTLAFVATTGGEDETVNRTNATLLSDPIILYAGTYTLTVTAYKAGDLIAARGTTTGIVITPGQNNTASVTLHALLDEPNTEGTFKWNITLNTSPVTVTLATMKIYNSDGTQQGANANLSASGTSSGERALASGMYTVSFYLEGTEEGENKSVKWDELLYVYATLESGFAYTFTDEHFKKINWKVTLDNNFEGGGSVTQSVMHGGTISRPSPDPARSKYDFIDWYTTNAAFTTPYDFASPVTNDLTLFARWELTPVVTVTVDGVTSGYNDLAAALAFIGTQAGNFTVTLREDQTMSVNRTIVASQNITITGSDGMRTINGNNLPAIAIMFTIGNAGASLTLGENITVLGRTSGGAGALVSVSDGGTFTMQENSRIQGHNINNTGSGAVLIGNGGTFNMMDNSVITGVIVSTATSAAVCQINANTTFNMHGGQITANSNSITVATTSASGGVFLTNGIFNMTGGSISGNTHVGEASDVYHAITAAGSFTMSGNAQIGALKLNATSETEGTNITIGAGGWTGSIETLNLRGNIAAIATASGYWTGTRAIFNDINFAQINNIGLGEFISSNNARQAIGPVYRIGTEGASLGRLVIDANFAPVTVTENGAGTGYLNLAAAFTAIGTQAGNFTITLREDQTITAERSIRAGQNITIEGSGGIRTIFGNTPSIDSIHIFAIGNADACLTLGNNVTIQGRTQPAAGAVINNTNGTFRMLPGSRITGHRSNGGTSAAVNIIGANSVFEMSGGNIDGNNTSIPFATTTASAGVYFTNGTFIMTGGSITGNTQGGTDASDVYFGPTVAANYNTASLQISGSANIGALKLNANSTTAGATVSIGTGWTGSITTLNLRGDQIAIATIMGYWTGSDRIIFNGITAAQVARIGLGEFISSNNARQTIGPDYMIGTTAPDLGRLIVRPDGTAAAPFLIYNETDLRAVGNGTYNNMNWSLSAHYRLVNNITLTSGNWTPIGNTDNHFTGSFDGDSKTISNLTITATTNNQGMFGVIGVGGAVRNLGLDMNITVTGTGITHAGGIAGMNGGIVENCYTTGSINGVRRVGGIVGQNGLENQAGPGAAVRLSHSTAAVTASEIVAGGVVGRNVFYGVIENCYSTGNVTANFTGADVRAGGIVGYSGNGSDINIGGSVRFCYATGNVSTPNATGTGWAGGIAGDFTRSTAEGNVALNQSVTGVPGNRVFGTFHANSVASNNFARAAMSVNGATVTTGTGEATAHGENVAAAQWTSVQWWRDRGFTATAWPESRLPLTLP
ncbi:MAG: InlB B-repeat-containing protein [Treponema sp.]|nr:InlB B-repeat-containing protein [Treponema sp.]